MRIFSTLTLLTAVALLAACSKGFPASQPQDAATIAACRAHEATFTNPHASVPTRDAARAAFFAADCVLTQGSYN